MSRYGVEIYRFEGRGYTYTEYKQSGRIKAVLSVNGASYNLGCLIDHPDEIRYNPVMGWTYRGMPLPWDCKEVTA